MKPGSQCTGWSASRLALASLAMVLLIACSKKATDETDDGTVAAADSGGASTADAGRDPCSLLESKDVEAALGAGLAGPPYRFNRSNDRWGPAADGDVCRYEGTNHHFVQVEIEWEGGAQTMKLYGTVQSLADQQKKGVLKLSDGSELTGEWDEAKVNNCCTFIVMRGDQLVTVSVAGSDATLEQAAAIADAALKRIDSPLKIDGTAGVAAAVARDASRPKERDPCSLVSRAEAETALEAPLAKDPVVDGDTCTYTYTGKLPWTIVLKMRWRDGYPEFREHANLTAGVVKALGPDVDSSQDKMEPAASDPALTGPWEVAYAGPFEFWAVKNDVLVKADAQAAMKQAHARNLVAAAMSKL
ncbi:MAG: hypothetical protein KA760_12490 [Steroidobacteraceae bacterium]|jgi:hypothetical protein|nr:hypothetical protein [Steroidobacteraceae bacterium]MBP9129247.1 hypothetical protein [Steroidobacteraceae bacterium]